MTKKILSKWISTVPWTLSAGWIQHGLCKGKSSLANLRHFCEGAHRPKGARAGNIFSLQKDFSKVPHQDC